MDDPWKQLPRAAAIVYVGVLAAGTSRAAPAEQEPAEQEPAEQVPAADSSATTGEAEPEPYEPDPIAPTCGPECHGGERPYDPVPPPIPPEETKKGCAVESVDDERGLAVLGLGLLAGALVRRRRGDESR